MCLAIPGKLMNRTEVGGIAFGKVDFGGVSRDVCLDFLPAVAPGDYVLVHVGFAISQIDEAEAKRTYELLQEAGALSEELGPDPTD
jgi:hydrogenase expression/formation protein HypC